MKKNFITKLAIIPAMIIALGAQAQQSQVTDELAIVDAKEVAYAETASLPVELLPAKALRDFNKNYKTVIPAGWARNEDSYSAEFNFDGISTKVFYDRKGRWVANIHSYQEAKLSEAIRHRVKSVYYDFDIIFIQEIVVGQQTAYLVKIEDKQQIKTIRLVDDWMEEYHSFEKSR